MNSEGWRRLSLFTFAAWLIGYYLYNNEVINLWLKWMAATPSTRCVDVLRSITSVNSCLWQFDGKFNDWWALQGPSASVLYWWFGFPFLLIGTVRGVLWVREGFAGTGGTPNRPEA